MKASVDVLKTKKSLIDLGDPNLSADFGLDKENLVLTKPYKGTILVEFIDETDEGDLSRDGIIIPKNYSTGRAWRKAVVVLTAPDVEYTKENDIVIFPSNFGVEVRNIKIKNSQGVRQIKKGIFLDEDRIFGVCEEA